METTTDFPPPRTLIDQLREIEPGHSALLTRSLTSVRSTLTRLKAETGADYTTRRDGKAVRVWRLS